MASTQTAADLRQSKARQEQRIAANAIAAQSRCLSKSWQLLVL
jgi:hypothetical protein